MSEARLEIVLEALNMASDELKAVQRDLGTLDDQGKKNKGTFDEMRGGWNKATLALGGVVAGAYAAKKVFDFAEEGAQIEMVNTRFDRLSTSIGTTSALLEGELKVATRGMMSDFEAVSLATDLMSLGLAKSHDEAVRLTGIASALNMDMNQLVLTLTNQTTMRFDALGLSVDGFKEKVNALEDAGNDANEAFKLAFMEQAEDQIKKVGHAADTAAGEFAQAEANWKNFMDNVRVGSLTVVQPAITTINKMVEGLEENKSILEDLGPAWTRGYHGGFLNRATGEILGLEAATQRAAERQQELAQIYASSTGQIEEKMSILAKRAEEELGPAFTHMTEMGISSLEELTMFIDGPVGKEMDKFEEKQTSNFEAIREVKLEIEDLRKRGYPDSSPEIQKNIDKLQELQDKYKENADEHALATKRILLDMLEQQLSIDGLSTAELELLTATAEGWGLVDQGTLDAQRSFEDLVSDYETGKSSLDQTLEGIEEIGNAAANAAGNYEINMSIRTNIDDDVASLMRGYNWPKSPDGRASGGSVMAGMPYWVGGKGATPEPELFVPDTNGQIYNQRQLEGMGGGVDLSALLLEMQANRRETAALPRKLAMAVQAQNAKQTGLR